MWYTGDPRVVINKRADIVIMRPKKDVGTAHVDVKETYCIFTSFVDHEFINANDKWDNDWIWTFMPGKTDLSNSEDIYRTASIETLQLMKNKIKQMKFSNSFSALGACKVIGEINKLLK